MKNIVTAHDLSFRPMITPAEIQQRVNEIGAQLTERYRSKNPVFLAVLNGAFIFAADLVRACNIDCEISFIKLKSYQGTQSSGQVIKHIGLEQSLEGRHVIIVEDIVDSGRTLSNFLPELEKEKPASIAIASLLFKPDSLEQDLQIDYIAFEIPSRFVIGYGLDYDGLGRNLRGIYQLTE